MNIIHNFKFYCLFFKDGNMSISMVGAVFILKTLTIIMIIAVIMMTMMVMR